MTNTIDAHVGRRIRQRRWMLGMSQPRLGEALGIRTQLLQAHEDGITRIPASRLWNIATELAVDPLYLFAGADAAVDADHTVGTFTSAELLVDAQVLKLLQVVFDNRRQLGRGKLRLGQSA